MKESQWGHTKAPDANYFLCHSSERGDLPNVQKCLKMGADVNSTEFPGPPLAAAAKHGQVAVGEALIDAGADVNLGPARQTPLIMAIRLGHDDFAVMLIRRGADINKAGTDDHGFSNVTPLTWACYNRRVTIIETLLAQGARIDEKAVSVVTKIDRQAPVPDIKAAFTRALKQSETTRARKMIMRWGRRWWQIWL